MTYIEMVTNSRYPNENNIKDNLMLMLAIDLTVALAHLVIMCL